MNRRTFDYGAAFDMYLAGERTLAEIGAHFGVTGSRIQQIVALAKLSRKPPRRKAARRPAAPHVLAALELVREGATFTEAAEELGISRSAVAGACSRAGLKAPLTPEKRYRRQERLSNSQRQRWARQRASQKGAGQ